MNIVLASGNQKKLNELVKILSPMGYNITPQSEHQVPEAEETGLTFIENAIIKARNACEHTGLPAISDDSGIEVDVLNGAPGIYSARFSGDQATDDSNNQLLVKKLQQAEPPYTARYQCVIVFMRHAQDPTPIICHGTWEGEIQLTPAGSNGFGYDPYFYLVDHECTAAELNDNIKNSISHRAVALKQLMQRLGNKTLQTINNC